MAVLKGEGRVPIIYGELPLPVPPNRSAYIARPDVEGEHPTVVLAHGGAGITPGTKALARYLARHGYAVMVPDLTRGASSDGDGFEWAVSDLASGVDSAAIPGTAWASEFRLAIVGVGVGGVVASIVAVDTEVGALVLAGAVLDVELLSKFDGALLVLHGADDDLAPAAEVRDWQQSVGRGEWIIYSGVGAGFLEEGSEGFDEAAATDAEGRIITFLDRLLMEVPSR